MCIHNHWGEPLRDHLDFSSDVEYYIESLQFNRLFGFTNFSLCKLMKSGMLELIFEANNEIFIKYMISNVTYINTVDHYGRSLIHYLLSYSNNAQLINYFINKYYLDLECSDNLNQKPIHYVSSLDTIGKLELLVNKGVDLECMDDNEWKPIHFACRYGTSETIKLLINEGVMMECININKRRPTIDYEIKDLLTMNRYLTIASIHEILKIIEKKTSRTTN